jgi:hypothetical protein
MREEVNIRLKTKNMTVSAELGLSKLGLSLCPSPRACPTTPQSLALSLLPDLCGRERPFTLARPEQHKSRSKKKPLASLSTH